MVKMSKLRIRMVIQGDLNVFERGMVFGERQADLNISQTADILGFFQTTISRACREWC